MCTRALPRINSFHHIHQRHIASENFMISKNIKYIFHYHSNLKHRNLLFFIIIISFNKAHSNKIKQFNSGSI